jgi:putative ABC transport system permease protein
MMTWVEQWWRDARHGWRLVRGRPGFATVVILSLGVGIGANTTLFSWIQALVFRPIPGVADATAFNHIEPRTDTGGYPGSSWLEYRDLQSRVGSFADMVASRMVPVNVGEPGRPERVFGLFVSGNYFQALGLRAAAGRLIQPDETGQSGAAPVAVISYDFWQSHFAGAPAAVGATLRANGRPLTIVGVTPEGFVGTVLGLNFDVWLPATMAPVVFAGSRELEERGARGYQLLGRLAPGATLPQAQAELDEAMRQLAHDHPDTNATLTGEVLTFWQALRGPQLFLVNALAMAQIVMLILLLAVCGNTANLVLARASTRQREVGVRMASGASRWRIVQLVLTENVVLALLGAAAGVALAFWGTAALASVRLTTAFPVRFIVGVNAWDLAFAVLLALTCGIVFGLPPALQLSRIQPQASLASGASTAAGRRMRDVLMGAQVALAVLLLFVAAASLESYGSTHTTDPGFRREGTLLASYDLSGRNLNAAATRDFLVRLLEGIRALPGVDAAAVAVSVPLDIHGLSLRPFRVEGHERSDGADDQALTNTVSPGYFQTMGIPILAGSDFAAIADTAAGPQVIVNQAFVDRYVPSGQPVGRRLESAGTTFTIVGVVKTSISESFSEPPTPVIYDALRDRPTRFGEIHVATRAGAEMLLANDLRRVVRGLDPDLPVFNVRTMAAHLETNLSIQRIPARIFVVLGPLLLLLAAIGIYAVVAYSVSQRTTEIGVRLALGATPGQVVWQFVTETFGVVAMGAAAGWLIAFVFALDVVRVASFNVPMFAGVPALLLAVAALAAWLPARRTAAVAPAAALKAR